MAETSSLMLDQTVGISSYGFFLCLETLVSPEQSESVCLGDGSLPRTIIQVINTHAAHSIATAQIFTEPARNIITQAASEKPFRSMSILSKESTPQILTMASSPLYY